MTHPGPILIPCPSNPVPADSWPTTAALTRSTVAELYERVERAVRGAFPSEVWITGEVRSMKVLTKGHCFLDLVDPAQAGDPGAPTLSAKCWSGTWRSVRSALDRIGVALEAGMVVRVRGDVGLYKARGTVDFTVREIDTEALLGRVAAERARLVKALVDEDLYDRQRRLPLPVVPLRIGLVASPGTEGCNDFLGGLRGSGLAFDVRLAPTAVQGTEAPASVAAAVAGLQGAGGGRPRGRPGRRIEGRPGGVRPRARGPGHRHLGRAGLDGHRAHRRPVGGRRGGQPELHHPHGVRAGAGRTRPRVLAARPDVRRLVRPDGARAGAHGRPRPGRASTGRGHRGPDPTGPAS